LAKEQRLQGLVEDVAEEGDALGVAMLAEAGFRQGGSEAAGVLGQLLDAGLGVVEPAEDQGADEGRRGDGAAPPAEGRVGGVGGEARLGIALLGEVDEKVLEEGRKFG
jgi:hypothetical protein